MEESNNDGSLFQLERPPPPTDLDCDSVHSDDSVDVDAPFVDQLNNASSRVWTTPECRPKQIMVVETSLFDKECDGKLLVADHTRGGRATSFE